MKNKISKMLIPIAKTFILMGLLIAAIALMRERDIRYTILSIMILVSYFYELWKS